MKNQSSLALCPVPGHSKLILSPSCNLDSAKVINMSRQKSLSPLELRDSQNPLSCCPGEAVLELDPAFNARHSNSEGLPEIDRDCSDRLGKLSAKDRDHFDFLNSLRRNLKVDPSKLINLECRLSGM